MTCLYMCMKIHNLKCILFFPFTSFLNYGECLPDFGSKNLYHLWETFGKRQKEPYVQKPTAEGLQRILTVAQQRDDDVHKTLAPYTDDILSFK